ncbi:interferon alpha/beta receptor 1a isoform X1 [Esox lucius]|uniref:interferon alpha/beta receptor 1a isoform X1 n=1 Tax=Esox lucius TaxID=8010 RepID=UPI00147690F5|nr:interferon alpha/beta receptor 1a isoform X1 [Esox lucius]
MLLFLGSYYFWAAFLAYSVFAALPGPHNLTMDAMNTRYILRWDWNHSLTNDSVHFTAKYTLSNLEWDPTLSVGKCVRTTERMCDFSEELEYSASYVLTVMAEVGGQRSNWSRKKFVPDEDAALGPPSHVEVEPGDAMVTVSFREPMTEKNTPMGSLLSSRLYFTLQYWEKDHPSQKQEKVVDTTERTLSPLKPWTEYCLRVNAFNKDWNKTSPPTSPQCVRTLGKRHPHVWLVLLVLLILLSCVALVYYNYCRRNKSILSKYTFPGNILQKSQDPTSLILFPLEECCTVMSVVAKQVELTKQHQQQWVNGQEFTEAEQHNGFSTIQSS